MVLNIKERLPLVISCSYNIIKTPGTVSCYVKNYVLRTFTSQRFPWEIYMQDPTKYVFMLKTKVYQ